MSLIRLGGEPGTITSMGHGSGNSMAQPACYRALALLLLFPMLVAGIYPERGERCGGHLLFLVGPKSQSVSTGYNWTSSLQECGKHVGLTLLPGDFYPGSDRKNSTRLELQTCLGEFIRPFIASLEAGFKMPTGVVNVWLDNCNGDLCTMLNVRHHGITAVQHEEKSYSFATNQVVCRQVIAQDTLCAGRQLFFAGEPAGTLARAYKYSKAALTCRRLGARVVSGATFVTTSNATDRACLLRFAVTQARSGGTGAIASPTVVFWTDACTGGHCRQVDVDVSTGKIVRNRLVRKGSKLDVQRALCQHAPPYTFCAGYRLSFAGKRSTALSLAYNWTSSYRACKRTSGRRLVSGDLFFAGKSANKTLLANQRCLVDFVAEHVNRLTAALDHPNVQVWSDVCHGDLCQLWTIYNDSIVVGHTEVPKKYRFATMDALCQQAIPDYCPAVPFIPHGHVPLPPLNTVSGSQLTVVCHDGYQLDGDARITCVVRTATRGEWTTPPSCKHGDEDGNEDGNKDGDEDGNKDEKRLWGPDTVYDVRPK